MFANPQLYGFKCPNSFCIYLQIQCCMYIVHFSHNFLFFASSHTHTHTLRAQAMVHELLGIEKHRVDLRPHRPAAVVPDVVPILTAAEAKAAKKKQQDDKEFEVRVRDRGLGLGQCGLWLGGVCALTWRGFCSAHFISFPALISLPIHSCIFVLVTSLVLRRMLFSSPSPNHRSAFSSSHLISLSHTHSLCLSVSLSLSTRTHPQTTSARAGDRAVAAVRLVLRHRHVSELGRGRHARARTGHQLCAPKQAKLENGLVRCDSLGRQLEIVRVCGTTRVAKTWMW